MSLKRKSIEEEEEMMMPYAKRLKRNLTKKYPVLVQTEAIIYAQKLLQGPLYDAIPGGESIEGKLRHLLIKACALTLSRLLNNVDIEKFERVQCNLHQLLVEKAEIFKEKDKCSKKWLFRLEQELLTAELELIYLRNLGDPPGSTFPEFIQKLGTSCCKLHLALDTADFSDHLLQFSILIHDFLQHIRHKYYYVMSVTSLVVEEVASQLTGIPVRRLPNNVFNMYPRITRRPLQEMVVVRRGMIDGIIDSFEKLNREKNWEAGLRRTFLFLGPTGVGKTQLAKAIALQFYGDVDRLIQIDTSVLTNSGLRKLIDDVVPTRPCDVILFQKIEEADPVVLENISDILSRGVGGGFSNTIIMTCSMRSETHLGPAPGRSPQLVDEARKFFNPKLMDLMDGIFVFDKLLSKMPVARLLTRDWAVSVNERSIVVYLSADVSRVLHAKDIVTGEEINEWLAENVFPKVSEVVTECISGEICAVYVDTLVGSDELSFRLESSLEYLVEDWWCCKLKNKRALREVMENYRTERAFINLSLKLEGICSDLKDWLKESGMFLKDGQLCVQNNELVAARISPLKDLLVLFQKSLGSMCQSPKVVEIMHTAAMVLNNEEAVKEEMVQFLEKKLVEHVKELQNVAFTIIGSSVLRSMNTQARHLRSRPFEVYLLVGFDSAGKIKLKNEISELVVGVEGVKPTLYVDLSVESSFQTLLFSSTSESGRDNPVVDAVRRCPYSVLVLDNIEKVSSSVYRNLIQVLDRGILHCEEDGGPIIDFRCTTIVLISNLGDKECIAKTFHPSCRIINSGEATQLGESRFRSELLNRVDDVLVSLPASHETLNQSVEIISLDRKARCMYRQHMRDDQVAQFRQNMLRIIFGDSSPQQLKEVTRLLETAQRDEDGRFWARLSMLWNLLLGPFKWLKA